MHSPKSNLQLNTLPSGGQFQNYIIWIILGWYLYFLISSQFITVIVMGDKYILPKNNTFWTIYYTLYVKQRLHLNSTLKLINQLPLLRPMWLEAWHLWSSTPPVTSCTYETTLNVTNIDWCSVHWKLYMPHPSQCVLFHIECQTNVTYGMLSFNLSSHLTFSIRATTDTIDANYELGVLVCPFAQPYPMYSNVPL